MVNSIGHEENNSWGDTNQNVNVSSSASSGTDERSATSAGEAGACVGTVWEENSGSESTGKKWNASSEARVSASAVCHWEYERTTDYSADSGGAHLLCLSFCTDLANISVNNKHDRGKLILWNHMIPFSMSKLIMLWFLLTFDPINMWTQFEINWNVCSRCLSGPNDGSLIYISSGEGHLHTNFNRGVWKQKENKFK